MLTVLSSSIHASQIFPSLNEQNVLSSGFDVGYDHVIGIDQEACDEGDYGQPLHSDNCCGIFCHFVSPVTHAVAAGLGKRTHLSAFVPPLIESAPSLLLRPPILHTI
ncbi:hypothetical protein [Sedimenticola hydrogenitrophicus]|uniref:hypothetical protein n=1 Tax=Sedimenticola hydrogenitrophicus TaxID=2967975 RepID=UPI0021A4096B|nr:hypothetical protein [Sedimenticola hydrogenitrophicus]